MTELHRSIQRPDPDAVTFEGFPGTEANHRIRWEFGHEVSNAGSLHDIAELYIALGEEGAPRWWLETIEDTVGNRTEPEQISFEEVLDTVEPKYWPVVYCWTLEALANYGWDHQDDRWQALLKDNPDAPKQLMDLLLALIPNDWDQVEA